MNTLNVITFFAFIYCIVLGLVVFIKSEQRTRANIVFSIASFSTGAWIFAIQLADLPGLNNLFWTKITFVMATLIGWSFFIFSLYFLNYKKTTDKTASIFSLPVIGVVGIILFSNLIVKGIFIKTDGTGVIHGALFPLFQMTFSLYVIGCFIVLYRKLIAAKKNDQKRVMILTVGLFAGAISGIITNLIFPQTLSSYGFLSAIIFVSFTSYAIITHQLFDIRVVIKRTIIYSVLLAFALGTYSMVIFLLTNLLGDKSSSAFEAKTFITNLVAAGLIAVGYGPLQKWLQEKTDSFLFKKEYQEQIVLHDLGKKLNNVIALDEALEIMMQTIVKVLHLHQAVTFVFQQGENGQLAIKRIKQIGYNSLTKLYLDEQDLTFQYFSSHTGILIVSELNREVEKEQSRLDHAYNKNTKEVPNELAEDIRNHAIKGDVFKKLQSLNTGLAIPLRLNDQPLGLILLSNKLSGDDFSKEDTTFLETVGSQAISSIQKAKLYEGDQMKSEFVSIASHELLTPISAIEGYLSMILDEHMGKVDPKARGYLERVYTSSKRLSLLVKDLLSVSRIEAGRMKIEPQSLDMHKMIVDTIDQLKFMASDKGLKIVYDGPTTMPPAWADSDRTMQVLVNLVSNSIKYSNEGTIVIKASQKREPDPYIRVDVVDTGIGMTKQAQSHLFEKFYRIATEDTIGIAGTGLGLYITKSLVERMGGFMDVQSKAGKGSTFSFTLPLFKVEDSSK